jgi:predicted metal-dependent HD superfamily phosphohydrolase
MNFSGIESKMAGIVTATYNSPEVVHYPYHNLAHTEAVVAHVKEMAAHYGLSAANSFVLSVSAWFHDIGHLYGDMKGHEERGVVIMHDYLPGFSSDLVEAMNRCILATKLPSHPADLLEEIICDADTYHFGTLVFRTTDALVEKEMMLRTGKVFPDWHKKSLLLLEQHVFFTDYCRELLEQGKQENIAWLRTGDQ